MSAHGRLLQFYWLTQVSGTGTELTKEVPAS